MDTRIFASNRRHARGAASFIVIISILILLAIAAAGWFLVIKPNRDAVTAAQAPAAVVKKSTVTKAAPPPKNVAAMSTAQLLSEASQALKEQRLLAPAGNNAFEFYLQVLQREPNNQVAKDALRETFPFGANAAEQDINSRDFAAAQRDIDLLAKADPDNYTLTILRSKLDAQRKTATKEQQDAQAQLLAQQQALKDQAAAAQKAAADRARKEELAKQQAQSKAQSQPQQTNEAGQANAAPEPAQPKQVVIQNAVLVKSVRPRYPPVAQRRRQQGWVEVQYTVDTDGTVSDVTAIDAEPAHVFNRAAVDAVKRWEFRPALNNGKPFPVTMRKRIVFSLGGN
jgi:protein TonB